MTQKSQGRLQRDALRKEAAKQGIKGVYASLQDTYLQQMGMFVEYGKIIALVSHDEVVPFLKDEAHTTTLVRGLKADIDDLLDKTEALQKEHAGKEGMPDPRNEDEHFYVMQLQSQYMMYHNVHTQNLLPVLFELDEHLQYALAKKSELNAQAIAAATVLNNQPLLQVEPYNDAVQAPVVQPTVNLGSYEDPAIVIQ